MAKTVMSATGMLMFEHLFVATPTTEGGTDLRFNAVFLYDEQQQKTDAFTAMVEAINAAIDKEFGAGKSRDKKWQTENKFRMPFRDALEKKKYNGFTAGKIFINPWTRNKPGIVGPSPERADIIDKSEVWAGQLARATLVPFAYSKGANKGASFMINNVQIVKSDMPRQDGRMNAQGDFDDGDEGEDNSSPF